MAKILLVEDEANIRSFIGRGLTEFGHAVTTAGDGASAWERIAQERFDLLVMDIMMPKISGLDLVPAFPAILRLCRACPDVDRVGYH